MSAPGRWYVGVDRPPTPVRPGPGSSSDVGGALSAPPSAAPQSTAPAVGEGRVATVSSRLLAYAGAWFDGDVVQVMTIGVAPDAQRRGLGAELLDAVLGYARAVGAAAVLLEVRVDNAAAIALYERAGFTVLRRRRRYYQPEDVDAWSMRREL
ncbi:MAG: GNAT family N-acetyltransferase [Cellulomonadaceae bacterium]|nr:GNAT family N-acetyltransferase [Cellulomonadaceae bacterium]